MLRLGSKQGVEFEERHTVVSAKAADWFGRKSLARRNVIPRGLGTRGELVLHGTRLSHLAKAAAVSP